MEDVVFSSKVDLWLILLYFGLIAFVGVLAAGAARVIEDARARRHLLGIVFICALPAVILPCWTFVDTQYTFSGSALLIDCGPAEWRIPVEAITSIAPTRSGRSGPALSLDRMQIDYGAGNRVLVSPADKAGFLAELERRR